MTIILQEHAKRAILAEFDNWAPANLGGRHARGTDGLKFFEYLRAQKGELLEFRCPGNDKWPIVHSWLLRGGLVSD